MADSPDTRLSLTQEQRESVRVRCQHYLEVRDLLAQYHAEIDESWSLYRSDPTAWRKRGAFSDGDGANVSTYHLPQVIDSRASALPNVMTAADPAILVKPLPWAMQTPRYPDPFQRAAEAEKHLQALLTQYMRLPETYAGAALQAYVEGAVAFVGEWEREVYTTTQREPLTTTVEAVDPETGQPVAQEVPVPGEDGQPLYQEREVEAVQYEGPTWRPLDSYKDLMWSPAGARTIERAEAIIIRRRLTTGEIMAGVREGRFRREWVAELRRDLSEDERIGRAPARLVEPEDVEPDPADLDAVAVEGLHEVYSIIAPWASSPDAQPEDVMFYVHSHNDTLIGATKYRRFGGMRRICVGSPFPMRGLFGSPLPLRLRDLQRTEDATYNAILDNLALQNEPPMAYTPDAGIGPEGVEWRPGGSYPVEDPQSIHPMFPPLVAMAGLSVYEATRANLERMAVVGDTSLGRETDTKRTATEIATVAQAQGARQDVDQRNMDPMIREIAQITAAMIYECSPPGQPLQYATGQAGQQAFVQVYPEVYAPGLDFVPQGSKQTADKMQRQQAASAGYQALMNNPLATANLKRVWDVTKKLLDAIEYPEPEGSIGTEQEAEQLDAQQQAAAQAQAEMQQQQMAMAQQQAEQQSQMAEADQTMKAIQMAHGMTQEPEDPQEAMAAQQQQKMQEFGLQQMGADADLQRKLTLEKAMAQFRGNGSGARK